MIRQVIVSTILLFTLTAAAGAQQPTPRSHVANPSTSSVTSPPAQPTPASRIGLQSQPSFWEDSLRMIREGGWDLGSWLEYRRRLLVENSLTNRYFWFSLTSYAANILLLYLFYASRVSEERKIWKATEVMTDLWNWALYADWNARKAIDKYNKHIDRCHATTASKQSASGAEVYERNKADIARLQKERDALQKELGATKQELAERDQAFADLNSRVTAVSTSVAGASDPQFTAQLMEKVNLLSASNQNLQQQLLTAQSKLEQIAKEAH